MSTKQQTHTHVYNRRKPESTVETCACGKFRFTENAGPSIVEQTKGAPVPPSEKTETLSRLRQAVAMLSQPVATNDDFDGRDFKYAYKVLRGDVESARAILNVEIGKLAQL